MHLDKDAILLKSWVGAICSIMLFSLLGLYTLQKLQVLITKNDVNLLTMPTFNALTDKDEFDFSMGFNIAAAFINYDNNTEPIDDPTVGELVFNHFKWGQDADGTNFVAR